MTFTILVYDPLTETFGGATATGNICVGGWVLRGDILGGISATQGSEVSTIWGEDTIELMKKKISSENAIKKVVQNDINKDYRQLSAIDLQGNSYCFNGSSNEDFVDSIHEKNFVISGNTLKNKNVVKSIYKGYNQEENTLAQKLISGLKKGNEEGGDKRGLMSAAILILSKHHPPIDLRVDFSLSPLNDLQTLYDKFCDKKYSQWFKNLPVR